MNVHVSPRAKAHRCNGRLNLIRFVAVLFILALRASIYHYSKRGKINTVAFSSSNEKFALKKDMVVIINDTNTVVDNRKVDDYSNVSTAPLFYHISPGSSGSRALYHAA